VIEHRPHRLTDPVHRLTDPVVRKKARFHLKRAFCCAAFLFTAFGLQPLVLQLLLAAFRFARTLPVA
jgi:hypothetical protein